MNRYINKLYQNCILKYKKVLICEHETFLSNFFTFSFDFLQAAE